MYAGAAYGLINSFTNCMGDHVFVLVAPRRRRSSPISALVTVFAQHGRITKRGPSRKAHPYEGSFQQKLAAGDVNMTVVVIY